MTRTRWSATALGIVIGGLSAAVMVALTQQIWWYGLVGVGLVLGAGVDASRRGS